MLRQTEYIYNFILSLYFKYNKMFSTKIFLSTNIYAVQQDTRSVSMSEFYSALMLARHVSDLIGPSSGAFCTSCIRRLWYVVIRVLLDRSNRYFVTAGRVE